MSKGIIDLDNEGKEEGGPTPSLPTIYRWGAQSDVSPGATIIPNWMLDHAVPMLRARGLSSRMAKSLWLVVIHLARYCYESPEGRSEPAVETIAKQIGVNTRQCQYYFKRLETMGLLERKMYQGKHLTAIYDYTAFSLAVLALAEGTGA